MTQFCIDCGAELRPNVKFCTKCGATTRSDAASAEQSVETQTEVPVSFFKRDLPHLLGAVAILVILVVGGTYFFGQPIIETDGCDPASAAAGADCAIAAEPDITGQKVQMFIVADANMRDRATAKGSNIIDKIMRGATVSGVLQLGEDGQSRWLKLDGGDGFIGAVNLSIAAPPNLAKSFVDMKWNVEVSTDLLVAPIDGSAVVGRLNMNDQVTIAGVTENGYVETKRNKGGVGYFLASEANDRTGTLMLPTGYAGSATVGAVILPGPGDLGKSAPADLSGAATFSGSGPRLGDRRITRGRCEKYVWQPLPDGTRQNYWTTTVPGESFGLTGNCENAINLQEYFDSQPIEKLADFQRLQQAIKNGQANWRFSEPKNFTIACRNGQTIKIFMDGTTSEHRQTLRNRFSPRCSVDPNASYGGTIATMGFSV